MGYILSSVVSRPHFCPLACKRQKDDHSATPATGAPPSPPARAPPHLRDHLVTGPGTLTQLCSQRGPFRTASLVGTELAAVRARSCTHGCVCREWGLLGAGGAGESPTQNSPVHPRGPTATPGGSEVTPPLLLAVLIAPRPHARDFGACSPHGATHEDTGSSTWRGHPGIHPSCATIARSSVWLRGDPACGWHPAVPSPDVGRRLLPVRGIGEQG